MSELSVGFTETVANGWHYNPRKSEPCGNFQQKPTTEKGIFAYNICLISISNSVSDGATNKSVLNIKMSQKLDVVNNFCATQA